MKAKTAATVILIYSILLFMASLWGAVLDGNFSLFTVPVAGSLFIGPAIGIYRRVDWCRIFLGCWFAFCLLLLLLMPFKGSEFHFHPLYLIALLVGTVPVFLLFFYSPLKEYTRNAPQEPQSKT